MRWPWLRGYAGEVRVWSYFQRVVKDAEEEIKRAGLSRTSWPENQVPLDRRKQTDWEGEGISTTGIGVCAEGRGEGASQAAIPGSTDVLESLFGKYKDFTTENEARLPIFTLATDRAPEPCVVIVVMRSMRF